MKSLVLLALFGFVSADVSHLQHPSYNHGSHYGSSLQYQPQYNQPEYRSNYQPSELTKTISRNDYKGNYVYGFETSDGTVQRQAGSANGSKRGYYSYVGNDGKTYTVCYIADELGYRVVGNPMLGAVKEVQCPFDSDRKKPQINRRTGYAVEKPKSKYLPPVQLYQAPHSTYKSQEQYEQPGTNPFVPPLF